MAQEGLTFHVLGSGAFAPERGAPVRNPAGHALETPGGIVLFDLGFGNLRQLYRAGLDSSRLTHAFFTHRHPDHVGDLPALLFQLRYDVKPRGATLAVFGPPGFRRFWERLRRAHAPWLGPRGYRLLVRELKGGSEVLGPGWTVRSLRVPHPTPALAYRLDAPGGSVVYSGDTAFNAPLARFAEGAGLLVLECTMPDGAASHGHLRVSEALRLAKASGAKRVLLSHTSVAAARQARPRLPANVTIARDLQRVRL